MKISSVLSLSLSVVVLSACCFGGSKIPSIRGTASVIPIPGGIADASSEDIVVGRLGAQDATDSSVSTEELLAERGRRVAAWTASWERVLRRVGGNIIYYDYDLSALTKDAIAQLTRIVKFLRDNPSVNVKLEGHTDPRGTREYNLALGERRAKAIRDFMVVRGVPARRVSVRSYGEEKLANSGDTNRDYALNRRSVIKVSEE